MMSEERDHEILYPSKDEIIAIHHDIIEGDDEADSGVLNLGNIDFALDLIKHGHFGSVPDSIHEKAVELMRYLSANHSFADGNKRTALNATWTFYALNGLYLDYGEEVKAILKLFAVMERMVDKTEVVAYFEDITYPEDHERVPTILVQFQHLNAWRERLSDRTSEIGRRTVASESPDGLGEDIAAHFAEYAKFMERLEEYRETYGDQLPEGFCEHIDGMLEQWDDIVEFKDKMGELHEQYEGEELEEKQADLFKEYVGEEIEVVRERIREDAED